MVDAVALIALALLVLGVVGSVLPLLPGPLLSLAGVYLYWWSSGFVEPGPLTLAAFTLVGAAAVVADYFGGAVAARAGGASMATTLLAAVVGLLLVFVAGPLGLLVGVAGTVFLVELARGTDPETSLRTAAYATVGVLASAVLQVVVTAGMLVAFVLVVYL